MLYASDLVHGVTNSLIRGAEEQFFKKINAVMQSKTKEQFLFCLLYKGITEKEDS